MGSCQWKVYRQKSGIVGTGGDAGIRGFGGPVAGEAGAKVMSIRATCVNPVIAISFCGGNGNGSQVGTPWIENHFIFRRSAPRSSP